MKKINLKSMMVGFFIGVIGMATALTVFASTGIRSAILSDTRVYFYGQQVPLENQLILIAKYGEANAQMYMPLRELLEYMNFIVEWDGENNSINLTMRNIHNTTARDYNLNNNNTATQHNFPSSDASPQNNADRRAIDIIEMSGTWGPEVDRLIPQMTPEVVDRIVFTYLGRQLFPGISTATNARTVEARLETALQYMTERGRNDAMDLISSFY